MAEILPSLLVMLIEKYENDKAGEFPDPDPIEAIKFKMEQMGMTQKDLSILVSRRAGFPKSSPARFPLVSI